MNPKNEVQGSLWCSACGGKKIIPYLSPTGSAKNIPCPICKGTGLDTYKGKRPIVK